MYGFFAQASARVGWVAVGVSGHARVMELILGGATHTLLRAMTVPVLKSH